MATVLSARHQGILAILVGWHRICLRFQETLHHGSCNVASVPLHSSASELACFEALEYWLGDFKKQWLEPMVWLKCKVGVWQRDSDGCDGSNGGWNRPLAHRWLHIRSWRRMPQLLMRDLKAFELCKQQDLSRKRESLTP